MASHTVGSAVRWSSSQLVAWVNTVLQLDGRDSRSAPISCLRETATGCFYAQILDALLPGKVRMNCVVWGKHGSVLEHEVTNNFKIIGVALHRAGVEHRTNFDAMVKGHQAAVLEFTHWLKNMSSKPFFSDRIRCYDPGRRRVFCKQSIRGQTTRNISRGRCRSKSGSRSRRRRMTTTTTTSSTGGPRTLDAVKGDDAERGTLVGDCNPRCKTAFNKEEPVFFYTTAGHGLPYRRTLRARKIPAPGSSGGGGGGISGDTGTTPSRHSTVASRADQPGKEEVHHDGKDLRWVWPQCELSSRPDIGHPPSDQPRRPVHGLGRREEKQGRCNKGGVVAVWNQGKSKKIPSPSTSQFESIVWDRELVVHHPRVPAGCKLRAELIPDDAAVGARRLESLFRETAEDGDYPSDRPVIVLGSMRGICSNGGSSVVRFYLTASGDTAVDGSGSVAGGGSGGHNDNDSWAPSPLDGENHAKKLLPVPLHGKGRGRGVVEEHASRHARVWDDIAGGGKMKPRGSSLTVTERPPDRHNNGRPIENGAKRSTRGGWGGGGDNPEGHEGCMSSGKGPRFSAVSGVQRRLGPSPPPLPRRRRQFGGAEGAGAGASAALLTRTRRLHRHLAA